jgi:hypothetical protein
MDTGFRRCDEIGGNEDNPGFSLPVASRMVAAFGMRRQDG